MPDDKVELINARLRADQVERGGKGIPSISATNISEGTQLIDVEISRDGLWESRYEATDKDVRPLSCTLAGPMFIFLPCGSTVVIGSLGFAVLQLLLWWTRRVKHLE